MILKISRQILEDWNTYATSEASIYVKVFNKNGSEPDKDKLIKELEKQLINEDGEIPDYINEGDVIAVLKELGYVVNDLPYDIEFWL